MTSVLHRWAVIAGVFGAATAACNSKDMLLRTAMAKTAAVVRQQGNIDPTFDEFAHCGKAGDPLRDWNYDCPANTARKFCPCDVARTKAAISGTHNNSVYAYIPQVFNTVDNNLHGGLTTECAVGTNRCGITSDSGSLQLDPCRLTVPTGTFPPDRRLATDCPLNLYGNGRQNYYFGAMTFAGPWNSVPSDGPGFSAQDPRHSGTPSPPPWQPAVQHIIESVGPSILITHSQSGPFGWHVGAARADLVKAIVADEPGREQSGAPLTDEEIASLATIHILIFYGDFIDGNEQWTFNRNENKAIADRIIAAGGDVTFIDLPKIGIRGNSHFTMYDANSYVVANLIHCWLVSKTLAAAEGDTCKSESTHKDNHIDDD